MNGHTELTNQWPRIQPICWALGLHLKTKSRKTAHWKREVGGGLSTWTAWNPGAVEYYYDHHEWGLFLSLPLVSPVFPVSSLFSLCVLISVFLSSTQFNETKERGSDRENLKPLFIFIFKKFRGFWNFVEPSRTATPHPPQILPSVHHQNYRFFFSVTKEN